MQKKDFSKSIYILPNIITTANLFCGFYAMIRAINGDFTRAVWVLILAGLFDFLDGRVARLTKAQSRFGVEYDSIVDVCSFGLAPALIMYIWVLKDFEKYGWVAAFLFFACGALRLARFNVQSQDVEKKHFQGLPIPAAAGCMISFILFYRHVFGIDERPPLAWIVPMTVLLALLMVSNVSYKGFKSLEGQKKGNFLMLVFSLVVMVILASEPELMLFLFGVCYVSYGIVMEVVTLKKQGHSWGSVGKGMFLPLPPTAVTNPSTVTTLKMVK